MQWVDSNDIGTYLKGPGWWNHKFVQEQFGFTAVIKVGRNVFFDKGQLKALAEELKERNGLFFIDLLSAS
jgi:hypothetical protein